MLKRPQYIALSVVIVVVLVVLNLPSQTTTQLKLALGSLFLPLFGLAGAYESLSGKAANALVPRNVLLDQIEQLRRENQQLRLEVTQAQEALRENARWRQLLNLQKQTTRNLKVARVIGGDPANWWRTLRIGLGSRDGLRANLTVLASDGLVGRISEVGLTHSQVVLVGDPACRVSAQVQETRDHGTIIPGSSSTMDYTFVDLAYLPRNTQAKPGQTVVTSGLGGIFPPGIRVGEIVDVRTIDYGVYLQARVKRAVNINRLEEVWVILP